MNIEKELILLKLNVIFVKNVVLKEKTIKENLLINPKIFLLKKRMYLL